MFFHPRHRFGQGRRPRVGGLASNASGFTLIELLVVIVILAVLSSLALPAFLNQAARAKQTKALNAVGAMNRAQHSFFYENAKFASSIAELGFDHLNADGTYLYQVRGGSKATTILAAPTDVNLRGYAGLAYLNRDNQGNAILSSLLCEGSQGNAPTPTLVSNGNQVTTNNCDAM